MAELSIYEQLSFCTSRIETEDANGNSYSGTGFFFNLNLNVNDKIITLSTCTDDNKGRKVVHAKLIG